MLFFRPIVIIITFFITSSTFSIETKEPPKTDNSKEIQKQLEDQKKRELEIKRKLEKEKKALEKTQQLREEKLKKTFATSFKRLSVDNVVFYPSKKWIDANQKIQINLNIKKIKPDSPIEKIKITLINLDSKESQNLFLSKQSGTFYSGTFDFSQIPGKEFYVFYSYLKNGEEKTIYYKLTSSEENYKDDINQVKKADKMLYILVALRRKMEEKRQIEENARIEKELLELKRAKAEIENLERKLESEKELLLKKKLEEERITKLKEAERQRQLYEQRLAEERKRRLEEEKARVIAERKRQLEEMRRKKAAEIAKAKKLVSLGQEEIINGEYEKAIQLFKTAKKLNPLNTDADFYTGVALFYLDNREEALKILMKIEEENPTYSEVHYYIASLYFKNQKYGAAVVKFKDAIKYKVKPDDSLFFLAMSYYKMEDYKDALKYFDHISKKEGVHKEQALLFVGLCHFKTKNYEKSINIFEKIYYESEDTVLAAQAEQFLRKARAMKRFEDRKAQNFGADIALGASQNSNVPTTSDTADEPEGGNSSPGYSAYLSLAYLPFYNETWDSKVEVNVDTLNYTNENHSSYETFTMGGGLMLKYKSIYKIFNPEDEEKSKNYVYALSLNLDYTITQMDVKGTGEKDTYSKKISTSPSLMVILSDFHIGTITLPFGEDDNYTDDKDTTFYGLNYTHIYFLDKSKKKNITGTMGFNINSAAGNNESFNQISLSTYYTRPAYEKINATLGLSASLLTYGSHDEKRSDKNMNFHLSSSRNIYKEDATAQLSFTYTKNSSNLETNTYSGWILGLNLTASY